MFRYRATPMSSQIPYSDSFGDDAEIIDAELNP